MAATAKTPKGPHGPNPRLTPRPTAASAARAARNATNRNLALQPNARHSPPRSALPTKAKLPAVRNPQKADSKTEVKAPSDKGSANQETNSYVIDQLASEGAVQESHENHEIHESHEDYPNSTDIYDNMVIDENYETKSSEPNLYDETQSQVTEILSMSRPETPLSKSRPQTPKSVVLSRPVTPRAASRPTTPAHPARPPSNSRPNTPGRPRPFVAGAARPCTPSSVPSSPPAVRAQAPIDQTRYSVKEEEDIKSAYDAKHRLFLRMKKELDLKQQAILEVFDNLRDLNERMTRECADGSGESFQIQELVVFNVGDWTSEEVAQLCRDAVASSATDGALECINTSKPIDECALDEIDATVSKLPSCFADLCLQAFTARQEVIDWVKDLIGRYDDGCGESLEKITRFNEKGLELCNALRDLKSRAHDAVETVTQLSRRACRERSTLFSVGESLVREIARLRQDLEARATIVNEMREIRAETDTAKALEETRRELEDERTTRALMKEKLSAAEAQLRQTRIRVSKMDRQLREADATIASLTGTVKTLEDQSRQREVQLEARARKLKESLKTGEVASNQIAQQRDALQAEVQSLKEQIETMTAQHKSAIQELNKEIRDLKVAMEDQKQLTAKEGELRKTAEEKFVELHNTIEELKNKNTELESSRPNPELPTEREMDLWAELQATKDALRMTEDEVTLCKREKSRFLETLTKIAESDNKVGMQQKLAAELLSKEEIVNKMQIQIRELTKNIKLNEQKVIQYEQYVRDLQAHTRAKANCQDAPNGISYQDLQQEIMKLRMGLLEAVHHNEELSELLAQKEQQLEQQDKTSRAQARVIKVREELINMLKNKETEQGRELAALQQDLEHRMKIVDEVNKQIAAKADEIQELFSTLENKQQQIHRLEKIVLALEEQQRRAQAQRTRHEEKIAALEHELVAGNRRERVSSVRSH